MPANEVVSKTVGSISYDFQYKPQIGKISPCKFEPEYASFPASVGYRIGGGDCTGRVVEVNNNYVKMEFKPYEYSPVRAWFP